MAGPPYTTGALYPPDPGVVPAYTQPGGPGTLAYPQQTMGEQMGLFVGGCGHWFGSWFVQEGSFLDPDTDTVMSVALVTCPLCGFLQQQIIPFDRIYSFEFYYIIG
jgi:hypothetical protein